MINVLSMAHLISYDIIELTLKFEAGNTSSCGKILGRSQTNNCCNSHDKIRSLIAHINPQIWSTLKNLFLIEQGDIRMFLLLKKIGADMRTLWHLSVFTLPWLISTLHWKVLGHLSILLAADYYFLNLKICQFHNSRIKETLDGWIDGSERERV